MPMFIVSPHFIFKDFHELRFSTAGLSLNKHDFLVRGQEFWNSLLEQAFVRKRRLFAWKFDILLVVLWVDIMKILVSVHVLDSIQHHSCHVFDFFVVSLHGISVHKTELVLIG